MKKIRINKDLENIRLDKALSLLLEDVSRSKIQEHLDAGLILVNSKKEKASYKLRENDEITVEDFPVQSLEVEAEDIPLDIVYEDDDVMVINKPKGLVVHPGAGNNEHTLANALKFHSDSLSSLNGDFRPGIVHRIDKDTAGLLVVAKNDAAHAFLANQLSDHTLGRKYYALVLGVIKENEGKIIAPIGRDKKYRQRMAVDMMNGKDAETSFNVIERFKDSTLVECILKTGRTHQIRVHMDYIGHPVIGDPVYGKGNRSFYDDGQLLFAHEIHFVHPETKKEMTFSVDLPKYFLDVITSLR
ncbi:MAG: RluA family pseudouridine synthase [Firmicutes bacterium]|nr:RluA family pseudouridine synthase [Candidatus Fiminaster equi]